MRRGIQEEGKQEKCMELVIRQRRKRFRVNYIQTRGKGRVIRGKKKGGDEENQLEEKDASLTSEGY